MAYGTLAEVVERTVTDEDFRRLALERPGIILSGYDLDPVEKEAVRQWLKKVKQQGSFATPGIEEDFKAALVWF